MKNWKIVYVTITGTTMSVEFETLEEMESWSSQQIKQLEPYCKKAVVWERFKNEWKIRHSWERV